MISKEAQLLKDELMAVVEARRECEAVDEECQDLLGILDTAGEGEVSEAIAEVLAARHEARRQLAEAQLHNLALLQKVSLTPLQRRLFRMRYVQGRPWSDIFLCVGKVKQYLLREHNKGLETLVKFFRKVT